MNGEERPTDVELHERLATDVLIALASLRPTALTTQPTSGRVTISQDAVAKLAATVDLLAPGWVDRVRAASGVGRLRRPPR